MSKLDKIHGEVVAQDNTNNEANLVLEAQLTGMFNADRLIDGGKMVSENVDLEFKVTYSSDPASELGVYKYQMPGRLKELKAAGLTPYWCYRITGMVLKTKAGAAPGKVFHELAPMHGDERNARFERLKDQTYTIVVDGEEKAFGHNKSRKYRKASDMDIRRIQTRAEKMENGKKAAAAQRQQQNARPLSDQDMLAAAAE